MLRRQQFYPRFVSSSFPTKITSSQCTNNFRCLLLTNSFRHQSSSTKPNEPVRRFILKEYSIPNVLILPEARRNLLKMYAVFIGVLLLSCGVAVGSIEIMDAFPEETWKSKSFVDGIFVASFVGLFLSVPIMVAPVTKGFNEANVRRVGLFSFFFFFGLFLAALVAQEAKCAGEKGHQKLAQREKFLLFEYAIAGLVCLQYGILFCLRSTVSQALPRKLIMCEAILLCFAAEIQTGEKKSSSPPTAVAKNNDAKNKKKNKNSESDVFFVTFVALVLFVFYVSSCSCSVAIATFLRTKNAKYVLPRDVITKKIPSNQRLCSFKKINSVDSVAPIKNNIAAFEFLNSELPLLRFAEPELFYWTRDNKKLDGENSVMTTSDDGDARPATLLRTAAEQIVFLLPDDVNVFVLTEGHNETNQCSMPFHGVGNEKAAANNCIDVDGSDGGPSPAVQFFLSQ